MATKTKEVGIRLSVKDEEVVKRALKSIGADGEAALKRIAKGAAPASVQLNALNKSIGLTRAAFTGMASGLIGELAGFVTVASVINGTRAALDKFGDIADKSKAAGLDPEYFQGIAYAAKLSGVEFEATAAALSSFNAAAELAAHGKGRMVEQLRALNPELLKNIQLETDQQKRLALVADALQKTGDKAALAKAIFGDAGPQLVAVFENGSKAVDQLVAKAREIGIIVDRDTIAKADDLGDKFDTITQIIDVKLKTALVNLGPILVDLAQSIADILKGLGDLFDKGVHFSEFANQSTAELQAQLAEQQTLYDTMSTRGNHAGWFGQEAGVDDVKRVLDRMDRLRAELASRTTAENLPTKLQAFDRGLLDNTPGTSRGSLPPTPEQIAEAKRQQKAIDDVKTSLHQQLAALTMTDREQAIANELSKAHVAAASKDGQAIAALTGQLYDQKKAIEANNDAAMFFAQTFESGLEGLIDGSKSFTDALGDIATALEKAVLQAALLGQGPLAGLFGTQASTTGDVGGILGSLLGAVMHPSGPTGGAWTGGWGSSVFKSANGNVFSTPSLAALSGSLVSRPTIFPFAKGIGLMGEAGTEAIMPLQRDSKGRLGVSGAGSSVEVNVTVINNSDANVTTRQRENGKGGVDLEVMVDNIVARRVSMPGSATDRALKTARGVPRQLTKR